MTPEEMARRDIDRQLEQCGWLVQDRPEMNISEGLGVAAFATPIVLARRGVLTSPRWLGMMSLMIFMALVVAGRIEALPHYPFSLARNSPVAAGPVWIGEMIGSTALGCLVAAIFHKKRRAA